ncbi:hypothetical protein TIFTF001_004916 [Ficus carica]|uniref:Uncharacterized protein n=1 Tax=Ficus carica TaxID=3494 RepID=A0AA87ZEJ6_FICCA|nr:hypothetical protein TIFTF001_004916 [Ficus carica]
MSPSPVSSRRRHHCCRHAYALSRRCRPSLVVVVADLPLKTASRDGERQEAESSRDDENGWIDKETKSQPNFTLSPLPSLSLPLPNSPPNSTNRRSPISLLEATSCFSNFGVAIWQSSRTLAPASRFHRVLRFPLRVQLRLRLHLSVQETQQRKATGHHVLLYYPVTFQMTCRTACSTVSGVQ